MYKTLETKMAAVCKTALANSNLPLAQNRRDGVLGANYLLQCPSQVILYAPRHWNTVPLPHSLPLLRFRVMAICSLPRVSGCF